MDRIFLDILNLSIAGSWLILAVLLIVLGLTIVIHSFKSYAKSERNSENA